MELEAARGRIGFRSGSYAELRAAGTSLDIQVFAGDEATLEQLFTVIERHLKMVEFRDAMPQLVWVRAAA